MLSFSPHIGPRLLPPLVYRLFDNGLFEMSPDLHQLLVQMSQVAHWLLVHVLLYSASNLLG